MKTLLSLLIAIFGLGLCLSTSAARADEDLWDPTIGQMFPGAQDLNALENIEEVAKTGRCQVREAKSCYEANKLAIDCALGNAADVIPTSDAIQICEKDFNSKMKARDSATYRRLLAQCESKFKEHRGATYVSEKSFCRLSVAALFSRLFTPVQ